MKKGKKIVLWMLLFTFVMLPCISYAEETEEGQAVSQEEVLNSQMEQLGIQDFLEKLNVDVIDALVQEINSTIPNLVSTVDNVWMGQAAQAFKEKLERDSDTMMKTLGDIKEDVKGQFAQIAKNIDTYDSGIAEEIKSTE